MSSLNTAGTIAVTNGSKNIVGSGTAWDIAGIVAGTLYVNGYSFPIETVVDDNNLTIAIPYPGATESGASYAIKIDGDVLRYTTSNTNRLAETIISLQALADWSTFSSGLMSNLDQAEWRADLEVLGLAGGTLTGALNLPANGLVIGATQFVMSGGNIGFGRVPGYALDVYRSGSGSPIIASANDTIVAGFKANGTTSGQFGTITSHKLEFLSGNVARATLTTNGELLVPSQPAFSVQHQSASSKTTGSTFIGKTGDGTVTVRTNVGSHFNSATGRFTAPVAGRYRFAISAAASTATSGPAVRFYKNGVPEGPIGYIYGIAYFTGSMSDEIVLAAGDYVEAQFIHLNGVISAMDTGLFSGSLAS